MKNSKLMLVDSDACTSSILVNGLINQGFENLISVTNILEIPKLVEDFKPDIVIFNYHSDHPASLLVCNTIKLTTPQASIIVIVSPGPTLKSVRAWSKQTACIDLTIEKPIKDEIFYTMLNGLDKVKGASKELENKAQRLSNLIPEEALSAIEKTSSDEAELFEAAVLFTDIRQSSQLIREMSPREFFHLLNEQLSSHAKQIKRFEGTVIKYTGDGVMATFRGMGRSYLALRCGLELVSNHNYQKLPFGVGIAEGLVLSGLIGDSNHDGQRRQYDVIGATVHLASRLCSMANPGEVIATKNLNAVARLNAPNSRTIESISVRGFDKKIDCIAFKSIN